ncbi:TlpA family protein disulfide reductase [Ancylobacter moscoviensis]|nr:TlpA disulfide reductase family protein [Ancylobacter moscoviensis]
MFRHLSAIALSSLASLAPGGAASAASDPPLPIGSAAPALALPTLRGGPAELGALQGRVVVVHFFATWCEPCREEMAGLSRLVGSWKDGASGSLPATLLAVDVGEPELRVRRFFDASPVPFPVLLDEDRSAMKAWKVSVLPASFVLDASHAVRLYAGGPVDWNDPAALSLIESLANPADAPVAGTLPPLNE